MASRPTEVEFTAEYQHAGRTYSAPVWGTDWAEAEARLRSLKITGQIVGSHVETIEVNSVTLPLGWLWVRLRCWWKNL